MPQCLPLSLRITAGQAGDSPQFIPVLDKIRVPGPVGRPRTRPDAVAGDKAYSSRENRSHLRKRGIKAVIPEKKDQAAHRKNRGSRGGRPVTWDKQLYKLRNSVERTINKIKVRHEAAHGKWESREGRKHVLTRISVQKSVPALTCAAGNGGV